LCQTVSEPQTLGIESQDFVRHTHSRRLISRKGFKNSRFDSLVARYYPAVYSFASKLTDDPRAAVAITREAFNGARKQLQSILSQTAIATILIAAVLCAGLASA
jgi:hypothetical protein